MSGFVISNGSNASLTLRIVRVALLLLAVTYAGLLLGSAVYQSGWKDGYGTALRVLQESK